MTTQLLVYNEALRMCGERKLATLAEDREPRHLLDDVWANGGVDFCLEQGFWQFCTRFVQMDYNVAITPAFGYNRAFNKPSDWVKTAGITSDEFFTAPLIHYKDLSGFWYASIDKFYVEYVSNGVTYGNDLTIWPQVFADYVASVFARKIVIKLTADEKKQDVIARQEEKLLLGAKNHDASGSPQKFPPIGNWANSRQSLSGRNRDRGNRGSLIG